MEEKIFVGYNYGRFETKDGTLRDYCNVFMLEDFTGEMNKDYCYGGQKAVKYGCVKPELFAEIKPGTEVMCFFDSNGRVSYMVPADKA